MNVTNMFWDMDDMAQVRVRNELVRVIRADLKAFTCLGSNFSSVDNFVSGWKRLITGWSVNIGDFISDPVHDESMCLCLVGVHQELMKATTFIYELDKSFIINRFMQDTSHLSFIDTLYEY